MHASRYIDVDRIDNLILITRGATDSGNIQANLGTSSSLDSSGTSNGIFGR